MPAPDRIRLSPDLTISRVLVGLWQVADIERKTGPIDPGTGAGWLRAYVEAGFDTFDMADHYGTSEIIAGRLLAQFEGETRPVALTKWCPRPGPMTVEIVRQGVEERLARLQVDRIDLLQFHWWHFEHPAWLDALHEMAALRQDGLIGEIGATNFDAAHLELALADGVPLCTNQVSLSLLDRRGTGPLASLCKDRPVKLLAYGTLAGGFLSERWLDQPEPSDISDWSKMKYKRFIDTAGGWDGFQTVLRTASEIARKHTVSIPNVATRWVLDQPGVAGVIIGARLGENMHAADNLRLFSFELDEDDNAMLAEALGHTKPIPGDCGDEYRKPPYLTASGDLSHHLDEVPKPYAAVSVEHPPGGARVSDGVVWEEIAGYCRARQFGDRILVSGTTATAGQDRVVAQGSAGAQTTFILDKICAALSALGASARNVVRTRIYLTDEADVEEVARAHGRVFGEIKPANTLVVVARLIGDYRVEIEAEAILDQSSSG